MNVGDYSNIAHIFSRDNAAIINLSKSYRSTLEITNFSRALLNRNINDECVERRGDEPQVLGFQNEDDIKERIVNDIEMYREKDFKSIGIITRTAVESESIYGFLKDKIEANLIVKDDDEYVNGTVVIPVYLARGLEFDVVLIYNAGDGNYGTEEERILFYTACTRALHVLQVYYCGEITPLIKL